MRSFDVANTELVVTELLMLAITLIFLVLLFFVVRRAVRGGVRSATSAGRETEPSAREALDRRYANGAMTREEYLTIKNNISREGDA
jgi:uncharacterized membrane protein